MKIKVKCYTCDGPLRPHPHYTWAAICTTSSCRRFGSSQIPESLKPLTLDEMSTIFNPDYKAEQTMTQAESLLLSILSCSAEVDVNDYVELTIDSELYKDAAELVLTKKDAPGALQVEVQLTLDRVS